MLSRGSSGSLGRGSGPSLLRLCVYFNTRSWFDHSATVIRSASLRRLNNTEMFQRVLDVLLTIPLATARGDPSSKRVSRVCAQEVS